jgi:hypothetical protein
VFENMMLQRNLGPKREKVTEGWKKITLWRTSWLGLLATHTYARTHALISQSYQGRLDRRTGNTHRRRVYWGFWWRNYEDRDYLSVLCPQAQELMFGMVFHCCPNFTTWGTFYKLR